MIANNLGRRHTVFYAFCKSTKKIHNYYISYTVIIKINGEPPYKSLILKLASNSKTNSNSKQISRFMAEE